MVDTRASKKKKRQRRKKKALKTLLSAYTHLIKFSQTMSDSGTTETINFPIQILDSKVFTATLREAWQLTRFSSAFVFVEVGYVIKHQLTKALRWFYPGSNTVLFAKAFYISDFTRLNTLIDMFKKEESYLITRFMNNAPKSGYVFVCFTNLKYVFLKPRPVLHM